MIPLSDAEKLAAAEARERRRDRRERRLCFAALAALTIGAAWLTIRTQSTTAARIDEIQAFQSLHPGR